MKKLLICFFFAYLINQSRQTCSSHLNETDCLAVANYACYWDHTDTCIDSGCQYNCSECNNQSDCGGSTIGCMWDADNSQCEAACFELRCSACFSERWCLDSTAFSCTWDDDNNRCQSPCDLDCSDCGDSDDCSASDLECTWDNGSCTADCENVECTSCNSESDCNGSPLNCSWSSGGIFGDSCSSACDEDCSECADEDTCGESSFGCSWDGSACQTACSYDDCTQCYEEADCNASDNNCTWTTDNFGQCLNPPESSSESESDGEEGSGPSGSDSEDGEDDSDSEDGEDDSDSEDGDNDDDSGDSGSSILKISVAIVLLFLSISI